MDKPPFAFAVSRAEWRGGERGDMSTLAIGAVASAVYLIGSGLVFILGSSYYKLFPTNRSRPYKLALIAVAAVATWLLMRSGLNPACGLLAFAFLAAATANVVGTAAVVHLHRPLRIRDDSLKGIALAKGLESLTVVVTIGILLLSYNVSLSSVYLAPGSLGLGFGIGGGGFALFALLAWLQGRTMGTAMPTVRRVLPWILLFVFANAFMEELWFRALFLGPLVSLTGPIAAIVLTALVFAVIHIGASYMAKKDRAWFLALLFVLGLAWGACLHFTGSIIASTLFHAGADLMIVNGFVAALHGAQTTGNGDQAA